MTKPPRATPHSDIDGVHEDEQSHVDAAIAAGQDSKDLKRAAEETVGRPVPSKPGGRDDRSG